MSSRKELFEIRESKILQTAEQLILESGEGDLGPNQVGASVVGFVRGFRE